MKPFRHRSKRSHGLALTAAILVFLVVPFAHGETLAQAHDGDTQAAPEARILCLGDSITDKVHPNAAGGEKMAQKFFDALVPLLE